MDVRDPESLRSRSFEALVALVESWRDAGRKTTTAGVTSALKQSGQLDLDALGFNSNLDFWAAAEDRGLVQRTRLSTGHWYVTLPGEGPPLEPQRSAPELHQIGVDWKLRGEVWDAFVDWTYEFRRFWDYRTRRLFFVPNLDGWIPEHIEPRFAEITPVAMASQLEWMTEFAHEQDVAVKDQLLTSLAPDAPRGAFRRSLTETQKLSAWRSLLQLRVAEHALQWAASNKVEFAHLTERLGQRSHRQAAHSSTARSEREGDSTGGSERGSVRERSAGLRALIHHAVDQMSEADLKALPLRGEHLLGL